MKFFFILFVSFFINIAASNAGWKDTIKYSNGDKYFGDTKDGKPHGKGIYTFANGNTCRGTFDKDYIDKCYFTTPEGKTFRGYLNYNNKRKLVYEVPWLYPYAMKCKGDKKRNVILIKNKRFKNQKWTVIKNDYEGRWCIDQIVDRERNYKILLAVSILVILGVIYLIILSRRNNAIHNHNLKHKTKFKKYSEYKERIDKIKSKELKKDEQNRAKLEKTSDLDDDSLMSKVKRLKSLYNNGTLTKVEFEKAKNKLLK